jgi:DNA-binding NarL/FixJ family response regulator
MISIVLADDHPVVRAGLHALLGSIDGLSLVAEADDGHAAVRATLTHKPDVVIMDIDMPGLNGIEATRQLLDAVPDTAVLMLTMYQDDDSVFTAMRAGARGYLLKGAGQDDIARAIHAVAAGEAIFGPGIAQRVLTFFATPPRTSTPLPELTEREREILDLIAQGRRNGDIGVRLGITRKTVANHISNIFTKLQVADRTEAIARARDAGLGQH